MKSKKQNGFAIELMIVFMLVTFAFCMLAVTFMQTLSAQRRIAKSEVNSQTALNQIGEYYMRSVEAGEAFPTESKSSYNYSDYSWMDDNGDGSLTDDDETVTFFKTYKNYKYEDKISITYGGIKEFFKAKAVYRRLTVTSNGKSKMVLTVSEKYTGENSSDCEIVTWYTGENVTLDDGDKFEEIKISDLKKAINLIWKFFHKFDKGIEQRSLSTVIDAFGDLNTGLRELDFKQIINPLEWISVLTEAFNEIISGIF